MPAPPVPAPPLPAPPLPTVLGYVGGGVGVVAASLASVDGVVGA